MSSLLFLMQLVAFALVAHWAFTNDKAGPEAGSKGLLRMVDALAPVIARRKAAQPRWKASHSDRPQSAARPGAAQSKARQPTPRWMRARR